MSFAAILGLVGSGISAFSASSQANAAMQMRAYELEEMRRQSNMQMALGKLAMDRQDDENRYLRSIEELNRRIAEEERQWQISQMMDYRAVLGEERQQEIARQIEMDREAARIQSMQIQQLLRNQQISADERRFAEEQLDYVKAVARGERDEDLQRYYTEQATAAAERDFMLDQLYSAQQQMGLDQERDLAIRERILAQTDNMQSELNRAFTEFGPMPEAPVVSAEDIENEVTRRQGEYQSDVDRAAKIASSQNEANLIRAGLDSSTPGTARRADVARELAQAYQNARQRAYDDALAYITGKQDTLLTGYGAEVGRRGQILDEIMGVNSAGMDTLMNMPNVRSLADSYEYAAMLPSNLRAVRGIESANNFAAPVAMGSATWQDTVMPGMSDFRVSTSGADGFGFGSNVGSRIFGPYNQTLTDPTGYITNASRMQETLFNAADDMWGQARDNASSAWGAFLTNVNDFAMDTWG